MRRKGVSDFMLTAATFFMYTFLFLMAAFYASMVFADATEQLADAYGHSIAAEKLLEASCATHSRGVFYLSSVKAGDFRCVVPKNLLYVRFESEVLPNGVMRYELDRGGQAGGINWRRQDFGLFVKQLHEIPQLDDFYTVQLYNQTSGERYTARMGVTGRWSLELGR